MTKRSAFKLAFWLFVICLAPSFIRGCNSSYTSSRLVGQWIDDHDGGVPIRWTFRGRTPDTRLVEVDLGPILGSASGTWAVDRGRVRVQITQASPQLQAGSALAGRPRPPERSSSRSSS
jgi:hypothetical protein